MSVFNYPFSDNQLIARYTSNSENIFPQTDYPFDFTSFNTDLDSPEINTVREHIKMLPNSWVNVKSSKNLLENEGDALFFGAMIYAQAGNSLINLIPIGASDAQEYPRIQLNYSLNGGIVSNSATDQESVSDMDIPFGSYTSFVYWVFNCGGNSYQVKIITRNFNSPNQPRIITKNLTNKTDYEFKGFRLESVRTNVFLRNLTFAYTSMYTNVDLGSTLTSNYQFAYVVLSLSTDIPSTQKVLNEIPKGSLLGELSGQTRSSKFFKTCLNTFFKKTEFNNYFNFSEANNQVYEADYNTAHDQLEEISSNDGQYLTKIINYLGAYIRIDWPTEDLKIIPYTYEAKRKSNAVLNPKKTFKDILSFSRFESGSRNLKNLITFVDIDKEDDKLISRAFNYLSFLKHGEVSLNLGFNELLIKTTDGAYLLKDEKELHKSYLREYRQREEFYFSVDMSIENLKIYVGDYVALDSDYQPLSDNNTLYDASNYDKSRFQPAKYFIRKNQSQAFLVIGRRLNLSKRTIEFRVIEK